MLRTIMKSQIPLRLLQCWAVFLVLMTVGHDPALAGWVAVDRDYLDSGLRSIYIDPHFMIKEGPAVTVRQLTDYKVIQGSVGFGWFMMSPHRFFSSETVRQIDCSQKLVRFLSYTEYTGHMGTGQASRGYVDVDRWLPIEPETVNHALWEVVCAGP
ncbi:MAG: surface-adhesin E family protein [Nitrospira sp.]